MNILNHCVLLRKEPDGHLEFLRDVLNIPRKKETLKGETSCPMQKF